VCKSIQKEFEKIATQVYNKKNKTSIEFFQIESTSKNHNNSAIKNEDQYIGIVRIDKERPSFVEWIVSPKYLNGEKTAEKKQKLKEQRINDNNAICEQIKNNKFKTIVIILESPHQDEFLDDDFVGVAAGKTGENLFQWFPEVLLNYVPSVVDEKTAKAKYHSAKDIESCIYAVKIVNAIQYQCSLGASTESYRDDVFSKLWDNKFVRDGFIKRVKNANPDIIINCCTKGNYKESKEDNELRRRVQEVIDHEKFNALVLRAAHPSSYHFKTGLVYIGN
jgi:hypothetical protein